VTGVAFHSGKLYVGLGRGLIEVQNGVATRMFEWDKEDKCDAEKFLTEDAVATRANAYIRTKAGDLLGISETNVVKIKTPGPVEAMFGAESGRSMAVFQGLGVFELRDQWSEVLKLPYTRVDGQYHVLLAAYGGEIALAVYGFSGASSLWVSQNQTWREIPLPSR